MNKTLVRLAREYVVTCENRRLEILETKTVAKYIDQFNWLCDMLQGNLYEIENDSRYYAEWVKVKEHFESLKVKARNVVCGKLVDVVVLSRYDDARYTCMMGRNRFIVNNGDLSEVK